MNFNFECKSALKLWAINFHTEVSHYKRASSDAQKTQGGTGTGTSATLKSLARPFPIVPSRSGNLSPYLVNILFLMGFMSVREGGRRVHVGSN